MHDARRCAAAAPRACARATLLLTPSNHLREKTKPTRARARNHTRTHTHARTHTPPQVPEDEEAAEMDEDEVDALHEEIEADFEMGAVIRERLIPGAVKWCALCEAV